MNQHRTPCKDCPWRKGLAVPGWLGSNSIEDWIGFAHSETVVDCHTHANAQCAGIAIYRANVGKRPRFKEIMLLLPADRENVFATPMEFIAHHSKYGH